MNLCRMGFALLVLCLLSGGEVLRADALDRSSQKIAWRRGGNRPRLLDRFRFGANRTQQSSRAAAPSTAPQEIAPAQAAELEKVEPKTPEQLAKEEKLKVIYERHIAKLPAAEAAAARKQRICPVMEKPLGSMGTPVQVDVKGRKVYICCEGCREELLAKPDETLKKIPAK